MKNDWLLTSESARRLYFEVARDLPIIDYHNHLDVEALAQDRVYEDVTALWIAPDPYKHRAMRVLGVPERLITGDATPFEKFEAWYASLPRLVGNPLYDWSRMEFERVFGLSLEPFGQDVRALWDRANATLASTSVREILGGFGIEYCAPCASLGDDLDAFARLDRRFAPSLRGDDLLLPTAELIARIASLTEGEVSDLQTWLDAVDRRLTQFYAVGCRYTDHALDNGFSYVADDGANGRRFAALLQGKTPDAADKDALSSFLLTAYASLYAKHGLTMQLHMGAQRTTSTRLRAIAGKAGGYAAIGNSVSVSSLTSFLDAVEQTPQGLPKTLLFCLNPADNAMLAILCGSYSRDGVEAIVSQGPAWWWCDHRQGMLEMLEHLACYGVLSSFVGMTTDSRSPLSFVRHDYFRRILCDWIGSMAEGAWSCADEEQLADLVRRICYENAAKTVFDAK